MSRGAKGARDVGEVSTEGHGGAWPRQTRWGTREGPGQGNVV